MTEYNSDILNEAAGKNVYTVPEGYFAALPEQIMFAVTQEAAKQLPQQTPYNVPDGYFESLSSHILSRIQHSSTSVPFTSAVANEVYEELENIAPVLNTISKANVYSVPKGYFEQLNIARMATAPAQAKVVSMGSRVRKWLSYSTAAAIAGVMITAAFLFTDNPSGNNNASVNYYKSLSNIDVKKEVSVLSEDEIVNYLSTHPAAADVSTSIGNVAPDIQHSVNDISEDEIREYLQENSDPGEIPVRGI